MHDRRRGQRAKFIEEIYRDWIIPNIVREITSGKKFLATLTADEMTWVSEQMAENYANKQQVEDILDAKLPRDKEILKQEFLNGFKKQGNKQLIEILKGEFEGVEVRMGINISGKQKNLVGLNDKILSIFQFAFSNPIAFQQAMQIPALSKAFQDILEYSNVPAVDFMNFTAPQIQQTMQQSAPQVPELALAETPVA